MKRSRSSGRPYVRSRRSTFTGRGPGAEDPGRLMSSAGAASRPTVDALEARQMLFSLVVSPSDPSFVGHPFLDNYGTVTATFGYAIPYLGTTQQVTIQPPTDVAEDFNAQDPGQPPTPVPSGTVFQGSNLQVTHNLNQLTLRQDGLTAGPNELFASMQAGQGFNFVVRATQDPAAALMPMRFITMDIGGSGLSLTNTVVELVVRGRVIDTFSGASLAALSSTGLGAGVFTFRPSAEPYFDTIRFRAEPGPAATFTIDDVLFQLPAGNYVSVVGPRLFGAQVTLSGPIGAQADVVDLYGRNMLRTIGVGSPGAGAPIVIIDGDDNGVPDFNDGIGKITLSNTDATTSMTIFGGTIVPSTTTGIEFGEGQFGFLLTRQILGLYSTFETGGFGYTFDGQAGATGLPPGPGSVIIGSPWVRDNTSTGTYNPLGVAVPIPVTDGFSVPVLLTDGVGILDQGIFVTGGHPIAGIQVHGIVHGTSIFTGSVERLAFGYLVGSANVAGDLGSLVVGSDAGLWEADAGSFADGLEVKTSSQLTVGRTLGSIDIAGRSLLEVQVIGDLNDPVNRPAREVFRYFEKENVYGIRLDVQDPELTVIRATIARNDFASWRNFSPGVPSAFLGEQGLIYGNGLLRNDRINGAEWVGTIATSVQIYGELGAQDPVNTGQDTDDVYAFASDGTTPIEVSIHAFGLGYVRIMDQDGRTVAADELTPDINPLTISQTPSFQQDPLFRSTLRFQPTAPGVYFLVIMSPAASGTPDFPVDDIYVVTIGGTASTSLGSYRTGAENGTNAFRIVRGRDVLTPNTVLVSAGSMGSARIGVGILGRDGGESDPIAVFNDNEGDADVRMEFHTSTISVQGNLYNITTGSDVEGGRSDPFSGFFNNIAIQVAGNFGTFITGQSAVVGVSSEEGDFNFIDMRVGGRIAVLDVRGGIGIFQDPDGMPKPFGDPGTITIFSGTSGGSGDIGMIRSGYHVGGDTMIVQTSPGSIIGAFLVSQDVEYDPASTFIGIYGSSLPRPIGADLRLGVGSDVRFFDTPQIDLLDSLDAFISLFPGQSIDLVDDAGGSVRLTLAGGLGGVIRVIPVDGSQGVAIGRIDVDLTGGGILTITGLGPVGSTDIISIGRISIANADGNSGIIINGNSQIDVWLIEQLGGAAMAGITNSSPNGDIVAIDVVGLNQLTIGTGSLGRTQTPSWGPSLIGPFMGITAGAGGGVRGALGVAAPLAGTTGWWNGGLYRPVNALAQDQSWLDDVGSPLDPYLNGIVVRTGNLNTVNVGGATGDVIVAQGDLFSLTANSDFVTPVGRFEGIVGSIYANNISVIDIGDGLLNRTTNALSTTGIFANNDIGQVKGERFDGAFISSSIIAADLNGLAAGFVTNGIDRVNLRGGGDFVDAYIASQFLDGFWESLFGPDDISPGFQIREIRGDDADFFRSEIWGTTLTSLLLNNGFFDASFISMLGDVTRLEAAGYRNSTLAGSVQEFHPSEVRVGGNLGVMTTRLRQGDIADQTITVTGLAAEISGRNMSRLTMNVNDILTLLHAEGDIRGSSLGAGQLVTGEVLGSFRTSTFSVSGPLINFTVGDSILDSALTITGPDGRIDRVTAKNNIVGTFTSSGPIDTIEATNGDMIATISTATAAGNIKQLIAGRDLDLTTDVSGTISTLRAGRNIGNISTPRVILVRGDLQNATMGGQLYSDLRVGQNITGTVTIGPVKSKAPDGILGSGSIYAFGRINAVNVTGDFNGNIISYSGGIGNVTIINGSFYGGNLVAAYDGELTILSIVNGHLLGDVHADRDIILIQVTGAEDGVFGDIGINPGLSAGVSYDALRNQLPPGVIATAAADGPSITAGYSIGNINVTGGSIFEAFIFAKRAIGTITVAEDITWDGVTSDGVAFPTVIAASGIINRVLVGRDMSRTAVLSGIAGFGDDGVPGGTGGNADSVIMGRMNTVSVARHATDVTVSSGLAAGDDGVYGTADDLVVPGASYIRTVSVGGTVTNVKAFADTPILNVSPGITTGGSTFALLDNEIDPVAYDAAVGPAGSTAINGSLDITRTVGGVTETATITFSGPGRAYWVQDLGRIVLLHTSLNSQLIVTSATGLTDFDIITNDDASVGLVRVSGALRGDSDILIDAYTFAIELGDFSGTGSVRVGGQMRSLTAGNFDGGFITALFGGSISIAGNYGSATASDEAAINLVAGGTIAIGGNDGALINVDRDLSSFTVGAAMTNAAFRSGGSLGVFSAGSVRQSRFSVNNAIGSISVAGDVFDTSFMAGGDLGTDGNWGGSRFEADSVSSGTIGTVTVGGDFAESDIAAGLLRGPDGFFGTDDDRVADGRSTIGNVTIVGTEVGSSRFTEQYRIAATGGLGTVTVGGESAPTDGNFRAITLPTQPRPIQVLDVRVSLEAGLFIGRITFNQDMDSSTIDDAISIAELRDDGQTLVPLAQGTDYTVSYDKATSTAIIRFSREVTDRSLPQTAGVPGPGVHRITLSAAALRASVDQARLDGDGDGLSTPGDDSTTDVVVGDAGDKIEESTVGTIDFYGPTDLDLVLDNNTAPDGLPDVNTPVTIRGAIGDNPDHNPTSFRTSGDVDVYKITLRAGQILRLGAASGAAQLAGRILYNAAGEFLVQDNNDVAILPVDIPRPGQLTVPANYLIKTTGTYYLVMAQTEDSTQEFLFPSDVPNPDPVAGTLGDYSFTLEVFDDGDSGFAGDTDSGNGTPIVDAPAPSTFAGPDGVFGTADDPASVTLGAFTFTLDKGADGAPGTADDLVSGSNGAGITSTRSGDGRMVSRVDSAIGPRGRAGLPSEDVSPDVDVFYLNSGQPIAPNTQITITVKLSEFGADLGSRTAESLVDFSGSVQFGLFDATEATNVTDGKLVFSPTDFLPTEATPNTPIAGADSTSYGYDANGDFTITFVTPGRLGSSTPAPAIYAVYLQGVYNSSYALEVVTQGTGSIQRRPQNIFIETRGGTIDWLEAGGLTTHLDAFNSGTLGFNGTVAGIPVDQYIVEQIVANLQSIFSVAGIGVAVSSNPADFEFQEFSTVFLTSSTDPTGFFNDRTYGVSEHSDPFNTDRTDSAAVFLPSLSTLTFTPARADVDRFALALTAAIGRRVGELLGLRITTDSDGTSPVDIMSANSVESLPQPGGTYGYVVENRSLSPRFDSVDGTNFFLGEQAAFSLLDRFITD